MGNLPSMTEPNDVRTTSSGESTTGASSGTVVGGFKLPSALHTIAFSTAVAVLTGISACIGASFVSGAKEALGLYALSSDAVDQHDVFIGLIVMGQVLVNALLIVVLARLAYLGIRWAVSKTKLRMTMPAFIKQHIWLLALLVVTIEAAFLMNVMMRLSDHVQGILFKNITEVGRFWKSALFEQDHSTAGGYSFVYSGLLALFVWLCWWLVAKGVDKPLRRVVVSTFGLLVAFVSLLDFAYLSGAVQTVKDYPIVAVVTQSGVMGGGGIFGEGSVPILLGKDDKMFAFLVVLTKAQPNDVVHKMIVYVPRSEVKYMVVTLTVPLYEMDKYDDLLRLEQEMKSRTQVSP
jgi:hypothetical protein